MNGQFLIVVDMQNDFISGSLGTKEAEAIIPAVAEEIRARRGDGYTVIATLDTHGPDYLETREGKRLPVPHCIRGTDGWALHPLVKDALEDAPVIEKPTFGSVELPEILRAQSGGAVQTIELIGLCTDICVVSNALLLKAAFPEAQMEVREACCAGVTPERHRAALDTMNSCQIDIL